MRLIYLLALLNVALCLPAQNELQRRPHLATEYVLGPGDQFILHVADADEISDKPLRVDPSGFVDLPLAGRMEVGGLSLEQFKSELKSKLSLYITDPAITVNLTASESQPVSVVGQVNSPGVHQLAGSRRLLEVISMSGGLKADAGDLVIITREPQWGVINAPHARTDPSTGGSTLAVPVDSLMSLRAPEENILIKPNDVISVPKAELVFVLGDVKKAGGFALSSHSSISLLKALSLAEGLGPDDAAKHARILRTAPGSDGTPREIPVDINKIISGKAPDVQLLANDVLFVPHSGVKVTSRRALEAAIGISSGLLIYR